jgi:anaerobic C4-dicarboxylate transporter
MLLAIELAVLLGCIVLGARLGGMALGPVAGLGLVLLVFVFGEPPGAPPGTVLGMILAVITALSLMQAAGGLDYVVDGAAPAIVPPVARITTWGLPSGEAASAWEATIEARTMTSEDGPKRMSSP